MSLRDYALDGLLLLAGVVLLAIGWRPEYFDGQTGTVLGAGLMLVGYAIRGLTSGVSTSPQPPPPSS